MPVSIKPDFRDGNFKPPTVPVICKALVKEVPMTLKGVRNDQPYYVISCRSDPKVWNAMAVVAENWNIYTMEQDVDGKSLKSKKSLALKIKCYPLLGFFFGDVFIDTLESLGVKKSDLLLYPGSIAKGYQSFFVGVANLSNILNYLVGRGFTTAHIDTIKKQLGIE